MQPRIHTALLFIVAALSISCHREATSQTTGPVTQPSPSPTAPTLEPEHLFEIFGEYKEGLFHHGYEVRTLDKKVVVKKSGKVVAEIADFYHPVGSVTELGLFDLLGDKSEQLIISMTGPRSGRHYVVSLQPEFRVLFDSYDYGVGREEFCVIDIDKDGIHEISLPVTAFYTMQDKMYIGEIPLPEIVFKYDPQKKKYLPANTLYTDYALRGLDDEKRLLNDKDNYLSRRLGILLRYIYAGKEPEGWAFFDNAYQRPDKQEIRLRIQSVLNDQPVYKYLYQ
jgi:hypothetical protein